MRFRHSLYKIAKLIDEQNFLNDVFFLLSFCILLTKIVMIKMLGILKKKKRPIAEAFYCHVLLSIILLY